SEYACAMSKQQMQDWQQWRQRFLARLAGERAHLLAALWALDEETLSTAVSASGWRDDDHTPKDLLAHVAFWDSALTDWVAKVTNGHLADIHPSGGTTSLDAINQQIQEQNKEMPLELIWARLLKERGGFEAAFSRIPDELLHRRVRLPNGKRQAPRTWARWRFLHDADHAQQLHAWRRSLSREQFGTGPRYILRGVLRSGHKGLATAANAVPANEQNSRPVCGVWTTKDVIGHVTDWEKIGIVGMQQLVAGKTPEFAEKIEDFTVFNGRKAAERADQLWDEVWTDFVATQHELVGLFDRLSDEDMERPFTAPWGSKTNGYRFVSIWARHSREHADDIRAALTLRAWPTYLKAKSS
ncbi:MAG: DinB family protein, partial [Chloroflexota bacterium]